MLKATPNIGTHGKLGSMASRPMPLVLVQNEITVDSAYDHWMDETGVRYQYPNQYRNKVFEGERFIYYRGVRRADGRRGQAEYFGTGIVGAIYLDKDYHAESKRDRRFFCDLHEYIEFPETVPAKLGHNKYIENIPKNHWHMGVRVIDEERLKYILEQSRIHNPKGLLHSDEMRRQRSKYRSLKFEKPGTTNVAIEDSSIPILRTKKRNGLSDNKSTYNYPNSEIAKEIGDYAEHVVLEHLKKSLSMKHRPSLRWVAQAGEKPGWDIEYYDGDRLIAIEVKGTSASAFASVEITDREWNAAKLKREDYHLYLVTQCTAQTPHINCIVDPYKTVDDKILSIQPTRWRITRPG